MIEGIELFISGTDVPHDLESQTEECFCIYIEENKKPTGFCVR